jgi:hypothetical protein
LVGFPVGFLVGLVVGFREMGLFVGFLVGFTVGRGVVGLSVGTVTGLNVGIVMGDEVGALFSTAAIIPHAMSKGTIIFFHGGQCYI